MSRIITFISGTTPPVTLLMGILLIVDNSIHVAMSQNMTITECYCNENLWEDDETFGDMVSELLDDLVYDVPQNPDYTDCTSRNYADIDVYGCGSCNGALSKALCTNCLSAAMFQLMEIRCPKAKGGTLRMGDCFIRYEDYDFYSNY